MKTLISLVFLVLLGFLAWPYYQVWQLDQAVALRDQAALARMVDLPEVRHQVKRRLNKDVSGAMEDMVSNAFVEWIQDGLRRMGGDAVERLVTLDWVRDQLLSKSPPPPPLTGFLDQISYAFFEAPNRFLIRIGELGDEPVHVRLSLQGGVWRVTGVYN